MAKNFPAEPRYRSRYNKRQPGLFVTGQTSPYDTGDDGAFEVGYTRANRWTITNDAVLYDKETGLYWPRDWTGAGWRTGTVGFTWTDALNLELNIINAAVLGGFTDWRIPNINELRSLLNMESPTSQRAYWDDAPWINNGDGYSLWSSTTTPNDTSFALVVSLRSGATPKFAKTNNIQVGVVAVRGGPL